MNCYYCHTPLMMQANYVVKKSVKPKGAYKRWREVGRACVKCVEVENKSCQIEEVK